MSPPPSHTTWIKKCCESTLTILNKAIIASAGTRADDPMKVEEFRGCSQILHPKVDVDNPAKSSIRSEITACAFLWLAYVLRHSAFPFKKLFPAPLEPDHDLQPASICNWKSIQLIRKSPFIFTWMRSRITRNLTIQILKIQNKIQKINDNKLYFYEMKKYNICVSK